MFNAEVVTLHLDPICTSKSTCGMCDRSSFPFAAGDWNMDASFNTSADIILASADDRPVPDVVGRVAAFELPAGDGDGMLCFPIWYFSFLLAGHGAAGVVVVNGDDSIFTLNTEAYTGFTAAEGGCEVSRIDDFLTFDVPRESGQQMVSLLLARTVPSLTIVLPYTDSSGVAPERCV